MRPPQLSFHRNKAALYLLDLTSRHGASKAKFFLGRGFKVSDWMTFADAIASHGFDHWPGITIMTPFGEKHVLTGSMLCPDGSKPEVLSVWMLSPDRTAAEFVTAYPA